MTLLLVDGTNLAYRATHAAHHTQMSANGVNTGPLTIFVNLLSKYVRQVEPTQMMVAWDEGHTLRDEAYPAYKAARKSASADRPGEGFALMTEFLCLAGIPQTRLEGYEADDLIAVLARESTEKVVILSGDKDLLQLVDDYERRTQIRVPDERELTESDVEQAMGVSPRHLPWYLALVGDVGDGVPGVAGIGPKKALAIMEGANWDWDGVLGLLGPERAPKATLMRYLVDLRYFEYDDSAMAVTNEPRDLCPVGPEDPERWPVLEGFLDTYALASVKSRLEQGTLWIDRSMQDLFEGL